MKLISLKARRRNCESYHGALRADYRWALTGILYKIDLIDLFDASQFLRVSVWGEYFWWNTYINKHILKKILLRLSEGS